VASHDAVTCPGPDKIGLNPTTPPCCTTGWLFRVFRCGLPDDADIDMSAQP
jgi:hypothetical protein